MVIKYCPKCSGMPYTTDISATTCPICNSELMIESVEEYSIYGRPELPTAPSTPNENIPYDNSEYSYNGVDSANTSGQFMPVDSEQNVISRRQHISGRNQDNEIIGTVYGYSCSKDEAGKYRRLLLTKIIDAIVYGQRTEDVLHRFVVRPENQSEIDIPVVVHGTISAGSGINNNALVRVNGKYKKGSLYANKINVRTGNFESPVKFQISVGKFLVAILSLIFFLIGAYLLIFQKNAVNGFFANAKSFLSIYAIVFLVIFIISLIIISKSKFLMAAGLFSKRGGSIYVIIDLILSVIITLGIYKFIGTGLTIGTAFSAIGPIIIMVIGFIILVSAIFR